MQNTTQNRRLFRGKRDDNGEWAIGNRHLKYLNTRGQTQMRECIQVFVKEEDGDGYYVDYFVDPETVGQCIGLPAAKSYRGESEQDRLIFEGDVVRVTYLDGGGLYCEERPVTWDYSACGYMPMGWEHICENCAISTEIESIEIVRTIHDNKK